MTSCREAEKTKLLIAAQKQKVVEETERKRAMVGGYSITHIHMIHKHTHIRMHTHTHAQITHPPLMHSTRFIVQTTTFSQLSSVPLYLPHALFSQGIMNAH